MATVTGEKLATILALFSEEKRIIYIFGGFISDNIFEYNLLTNELTMIDSMQTHRENFGCVKFGNDVFLAGGICKNNTYLASVDIYKIGKKTWSVSTPMFHKRAYFAMVLLGTHVYVIGGENAINTAISCVERFDISTNRCSQMKSLQVPRSGHTACVVGRNIYVGGGHDDDDNALNSMEVFNVDENIWTFMTSLSRSSTFSSLLYV